MTVQEHREEPTLLIVPRLLFEHILNTLAVTFMPLCSPFHMFAYALWYNGFSSEL